MEPIGFLLSAPWGIVFYTLAWVVLYIIIAEIWWKKMDHLPEDELEWDDSEDAVHFVLESEEDFFRHNPDVKSTLKY